MIVFYNDNPTNIILKIKFADYYIYDIPAVLKSQLVGEFTISYGRNASEFIYSMLYAVYAISNIILPLIGGVLTDKFGFFCLFFD